MSLQKNHTGCLMPWDRIRPLNTDMPELISIAQSNTVTRHTMIDRKTGTVFSLLGADGKHLVNLTKTTRTVQDVRFKRQLILGISTFGKNNGNFKKKKTQHRANIINGCYCINGISKRGICNKLGCCNKPYYEHKHVQPGCYYVPFKFNDSKCPDVWTFFSKI